MAHSITIMGKLLYAPSYSVYKGKDYAYFVLDDTTVNKRQLKWYCYISGEAVKKFRLNVDKDSDILVNGHIWSSNFGKDKVLVEWFTCYPDMSNNYVRWDSEEEIAEVLEDD